MNESLEEKYHKYCQLLVDRGLACALVRDTNKTVLVWTPEGAALQRHLRQLFNVPQTDVKDIPAEDVIDLIFLVLMFSGETAT